MKTNAPGYVKDERTGLVSNQNLAEYELIKTQRRAAADRRELERRVARLEETVAGLQASIRELVGKC